MTATKWRHDRRLRTRTPHTHAGALRRRPAWYLIALAAVGILAAVLGILELGSPTSSARTAKEIVTAERGVVQSTVTGSGDVEPAVDDSVSFQASGTLQHLYVKQDDHVVKGQLLATLDPTSARDTVDQAEQELTAAKDSLSAAETTSTSASTSDSSAAVDRGDQTSFVAYSPTSTTTATTSSSTPTSPTVSQTTPSPLTATSPATTTVTVTVPSTTTTTTPSSATGGEGSGSGTGDAAGTGSDSGTGNESGTGAGSSTGSGSGTGTGTGSSGSGSSQTTTSNPDTLAANIASAQAQVDSAEATLKSAKTALARTKLYAPASGTVVSVGDISPGDAVSGASTSSSDASSAASSGSSSSSTGGTASGSLSGSSDSSTSSSTSSTGLVEIVNTHRMTVTVPFDEADISKLKVGQPSTVTFDALTGVELAAKVSSISTIPTTSDSVVSYDATLTLKQRNAQVKPGMTASVAVIDRQASGVTLPNSAVPGTSNTATVDVTANGRTTSREVIVGVRGDSRTQIVKGLSAGQQVVVTETLPSTGTESSSGSSGSSSSSGTLGGTTGGFGGAAAGGGFPGGGGFGGGGSRFGGG